MSEPNACVFDIGSFTSKVGFAGEEIPIIFPTQISGEKSSKPVEKSCITDFNGIEEVWKYSFEALHTNSRGRNLLITEAPFNPEANREKTAEILFETFNISAIYLAIPAALSLYSTGKTSGVVIDAGYQVTHSVPIHESRIIKEAVRRDDFGGRDVTALLQASLLEIYPLNECLHTIEVIRQTKENVCYVCPRKDIDQEITDPRVYTLPDGSQISLRNEARQCCEAIFNAQIRGKECMGIDLLTFYSIMGCDVNIRRSLYRNVYLCGGTALSCGYKERIDAVLKEMAPYPSEVSVRVNPPVVTSAWIGGSILASFSDYMKSASFSKEDYAEKGASYIKEKAQFQ